VLSTSARENTVTIEKRDGQTVTYNPQRLRGVNVFETAQREFDSGDRLQFTAPDKELGVVRRELGTIEKLSGNEITVKLDGKESVPLPSIRRSFVPSIMAMPSRPTVLRDSRPSAPSSTSTWMDRGLVNNRLAYVAVSRAAHEAQIYTNDARGLAAALSTEYSEPSR